MIAVPDLRWARRDIKSTSLLAQVLAKQEAKAKGGKEAVMHEDGVVTEAGSSSLFMVTLDGRIVTRPNGTSILPGITRASLAIMAAEHQLHFEERLFTLDEMRQAREVFITAASTFVVAGVIAGWRTDRRWKAWPYRQAAARDLSFRSAEAGGLNVFVRRSARRLRGAGCAAPPHGHACRPPRSPSRHRGPVRRPRW